MSGNSLNITHTLVTTTTQTINVQGQSITNLSGIQYFSSLQYLDCALNSLTNLPALSNSLQILDCHNNSLTSLPALPNSITYLGCFSNSLTNLPVLPNSLQLLYCFNNNIMCFPTFPTSITNINISSNPYTCLPNYVLPAMNPYTTTPLCAPGNTNGCVVIGIKELKQNNHEITIFPNPTSGQIIVETSMTEKQTVHLFDLNGKLLLSQNLDDKKNIDFSSFTAGVYNLVIKTSDDIINKKLVIVR